MYNIFKAVIMSQIKDINNEIDFTLFFNVLENDESRMAKIKDRLYGEKRLHSVASINPENRIYEIKTTLMKMTTIFESLEPFIERGEYMTYFSSDRYFNVCYGPKNNEVVVELL